MACFAFTIGERSTTRDVLWWLAFTLSGHTHCLSIGAHGVRSACAICDAVAHFIFLWRIALVFASLAYVVLLTGASVKSSRESARCKAAGLATVCFVETKTLNAFTAVVMLASLLQTNKLAIVTFARISLGM